MPMRCRIFFSVRAGAHVRRQLDRACVFSYTRLIRISSQQCRNELRNANKIVIFSVLRNAAQRVVWHPSQVLWHLNSEVVFPEFDKLPVVKEFCADYHPKMNRRAGIGAIDKKKITEAQFARCGEELAADQMKQLSGQLGTLREKLEEFASRHTHEIRKNPEFRRQFQDMCASIGVDPLASSKGSGAKYWVLEIFITNLECRLWRYAWPTTTKTEGSLWSLIDGYQTFNRKSPFEMVVFAGIMPLYELCHRLIKSRGKPGGLGLSTDDVLRAIEKLKVLGNGFALIRLNRGKILVQSVPGELSLDQNQVIKAAQETASTTPQLLKAKLSWQEERSQKVLRDMVREGLVWVDLFNKNEVVFWFPSLFSANASLKAES